MKTMALCTIAVTAAAPALAQNPLVDPGPVAAVWLQLQRPSLESDVSSLLLDGGAQVRLGARSFLVIRIPVAHVAEDLPAGAKSTLIGNPYVGLRQRTGSTDLEVGGRIPIVADDGSAFAPAAIGVMADFDQFEAYLPDVLTLYLRFAVAREPESGRGATTRVRLGPTVFVPRTDDPSDETEVMLDYSFQAGYRTPAWEAGGALTGRFVVTNADGADFGERTIHQLTLGASLRGGRVRPTAFVRIPLDEDSSEGLKTVFGVGVVMDLR